MAVLGYGMQPAGLTPAGYGTPALAPLQPGGLLVDPTTGQSTGAALIDYRTRDFVIGADGRRVGMSPVKQIVQLAISTRFGSAAVRTMGQDLASIDRITANIEARCLSILTNALQSAINQGLVAVLGFSAFKAARPDGLREGQVYGRLRWRDLTTGQEHEDFV